MVQRIEAVQRIASHRLLVFIILVDVGITHNQHFRIRLVDGQITVGYIESHIGKGAVCIHKLTFSQSHVGGAGVSSVGRCSAVKHKVSGGI